MFCCYVCPCVQVPLWDGSIRAIMALREIECWSLLTRRIPDTGTRQQSEYQLTGYYNYLCWPGSMDTCQHWLVDWVILQMSMTAAQNPSYPDYSMHNPNPGLISCKSSPARHCLWPPVNDTTPLIPGFAQPRVSWKWRCVWLVYGSFRLVSIERGWMWWERQHFHIIENNFMGYFPGAGPCFPATHY